MEWISVKDRMPEPDSDMLLWTVHQNGIRKVWCKGFYAPKNTVEYNGGDEWGLVADYDEETDNFYLPEGWYEKVEHWDDISFVQISDTVTHWMPLLKIPKEEKK